MSEELVAIQIAISDTEIEIEEGVQGLDRLSRQAVYATSEERVRLLDQANRRLDANRIKLENLRIRERAVRDHESRLASDAVAAAERVKADERTFWFRRFHTSLAIAHGAALAAIASKLLDPGVSAYAMRLALIPMFVFSVGMILAGTIPYVLAREQRTAAQRLANASGGLFVTGLAGTLLAIWFVANQPPRRVHLTPLPATTAPAPPPSTPDPPAENPHNLPARAAPAGRE